MNFSTWYGFYQNIWYIFSSVSTVSELQRKDYKVVCISGDTSECHGGVRSKKLGLDYKLFVGKCIHPVNWAMLISAISDPLNTDMFRQMHRRTCPKKVHILFITLQLFTNTLRKTSYVDERPFFNFISWRTCPKKLHILFITLQLFTNIPLKTSYVDEQCLKNLICYFSHFSSYLSLTSFLDVRPFLNFISWQTWP